MLNTSIAAKSSILLSSSSGKCSGTSEEPFPLRTVHPARGVDYSCGYMINNPKVVIVNVVKMIVNRSLTSSVNLCKITPSTCLCHFSTCKGSASSNSFTISLMARVWCNNKSGRKYSFKIFIKRGWGQRQPPEATARGNRQRQPPEATTTAYQQDERNTLNHCLYTIRSSKHT